MKIVLSLIKADIGSIGGHLKPSRMVLGAVKKYISGNEFVIDGKIFYTGDDIALLLAHQQGMESRKIHQLAWEAFEAGTEVAKQQGLYGAGQDLLKDAFAGNIKGLGPGIAEMEFEERPNEPFIVFMADKTDPGAYNLPFYLAFADPMHNAGLILSPKMKEGFRFTIIDANYTKCDRVIELNAPEELYDLACLLRDTERFMIESVHARSSGEQVVVVSTTRLHNIAGKYTGKDDPVAIVRTQSSFPSTGEVLSPFRIGHYVAGFMRGSHNGPLMPSKLGSTISFFDGPPIVTGAALCVQKGRLTEVVDVFDHPFWEHVRQQVSEKAIAIREQGFFGNAMLGMNELEYGGITEKLAELDQRFKLRKG